MTSTGPELTVVIPTRDRPAALRTALTSLRVGGVTCAVVVVDDGSDDRNIRPVEELARHHVRVVRQANAGPSAARNRGVEVVDTPFVVFLDDDDEIRPHGLAALLEAVAGDDVGVASSGGVTRFPSGFERVEPPRPGRGLKAGARGRWLPGSYVVRTSVFAAVGGFDEALRQGENDELAIRLIDACRDRGLRVVSIDDLTVTRHLDGRRTRWAERLRTTETILDRYGARLARLPDDRERYLRSAAVHAARLGQTRRALRHACRALAARPLSLRSYGRVVLVLLPPIARRVWRRPVAWDPGAP